MSGSTKITSSEVNKCSSFYVISVLGASYGGQIFMTSTERDENVVRTTFDAFKIELQKKLGDIGLDRIKNIHVRDVKSYEIDLKNDSDNFFDFHLSKEFEKESYFMGFFRDDRPLPVIRPMKGKSKAQMESQDIGEDEFLDFDIYIYLKRNKKYFKYVRENGFLLRRQIEAIRSTNTYIYINFSDIEKANRFYLLKKINNSIAASGISYTMAS